MTQFEDLHEKIEGYKVMRKLNRTALKNLMIDYDTMQDIFSDIILNRKERLLQRLCFPVVDVQFKKQVNSGHTKLVEVDKKYVMFLLIDHSSLIGYLQEADVSIS